MNTLSAAYLTSRLARPIAPAVSPEVQQLTDQFSAQTEQILTDFACCGLLVTSLAAATALLFGSLLLLLHHPPMRTALPTLRLLRHEPVQRYPKRPLENRVAKANRDELRLVSARLRAGQLNK